MTKRKQPITSILAHNSIKESKSAMYAKIVEGLEKLRVGGTFDEVAAVTGLKPQQVWKRYSEMQGLGLIFNVGITRPGVSGRACTVWQLTLLKPKPQTGKAVQVDLFS
jgi:hypothetical protein